MVDDYYIIKEKLEKTGQEHVISFWDELSEDERAKLKNQILGIDFEKMKEMYEASKNNDYYDASEITPIPYYDSMKISEEDKNRYISIGEDIVKKGEIAVISMAGGQGTRLGYHGPKATFELNLIPKKSLFEILCDNLKDIKDKYGVELSWYIMTSEENHDDTIKFFDNKNYFNYAKEKIKFFNQEKLPILDLDGKIILDKKWQIKEAANGNGDVFRALKHEGLINEMKQNGIKWISIGGIDNVLLKLVDLLFIGMAVESGYEIASKSAFKEIPDDPISVFCKRKGKPSILEHSYIPLDMSNEKDENGNYLYREVNILAHLFKIDALEKLQDVVLPYHRAFKKNAFINYEGVKEVPIKPNSFKFEKFIFDAFSHFDDMLLLRVNEEEEFAPIKDFTGIYSPETAKIKYVRYWEKQGKEIKYED